MNAIILILTWGAGVWMGIALNEWASYYGRKRADEDMRRERDLPWRRELQERWKN